jgi:hypothetical protein
LLGVFVKKIIVSSLLFITCLVNATVSVQKLSAEVQNLTNKLYIEAVREFEKTEEYKMLSELFDDLMEKNKGNYFAVGGDSSDADYQAWCDAYDRYQQAQVEIMANVDVFRLARQLEVYVQVARK